MADDPKKLLAQALAAKDKARTPEQQAHHDEITRRNKAMQTHGIRAVDGVTFGKQLKGKP